MELKSLFIKALVGVLALLSSLFSFSADYTMAPGSVNLACGTSHNFYDPGGSAANYTNNLNVTETFTSAALGQCLSITINTFNTENGSDFLTIYDGPTAASPQLASLSGNGVAPITFTGTSGSLTFVFTSNGSVLRFGWTATISCAACPPPAYNLTAGNVNLPCGTTYNFYDSGGAGGDYANSLNITETFTSANAAQCLSVTFNTFSAEGGFDFLRIYDGATTGSPLIGTLTGTGLVLPQTFTSSSGSLTFSFISDGSVAFFGWTATISCAACPPPPAPFYNLTAGNVNLPCGTTYNFYDSGGVGGNYVNSLNITETFTAATPGQCVTATISTFGSEAGFDFLRVYDGATTGSLLIGTLNGQALALPQTFTSSSGSLTFSFISDVSGVSFGWTGTISCTSSCAPPPPPPAPFYNLTAGNVNLPCGTTYNFYDSGGVVGDYANSLNITETFTAATSGQCVTATISTFGSEIGLDILRIYDGATTGSTLIGTLTGAGLALPQTFTSSSGSLTFSFISDGSIVSFGWTGTISCTSSCALPPPPPPPPPPPNENGDSCTNATPFCTGTTYNFPNNTGQAGLGAINCLFSTPNPVWYYMQIEESGVLNMSISQTNTAGIPIDVDFNLWGPFTSQADGCAQISSGIAPNVDCSFSASAFEEANILNAIAGEFYIMLLTNYSGQAGTISFNSLGTSTATTNCALLCNITNLTATPTACSPSTNTFDLNGVVTVLNPPNSGVLTVSSSCGGSVTIPQPWGTSIPYSLPSLNPTGGACTVTATFSEDLTCNRTQNFTSPAPCSSVVLNCPQYASTSASPNVACANQTYYLEVENNGCNGTVTMNVLGNYGSSDATEITWNLVSNLTGTVVASGGPGVNGGVINTTVGPLNANIEGTIFTLNVFDSFGDGFNGTGGTISVSQNSGAPVAGPITGNFGSESATIFGANVIISAATMTINTPSGNVIAVAQNCSDFRVPITLENDNFCNTLNVNLPWTIVCNSTGATLASGSQNITIHPSVPNDANDVVDITWNASTCQWQVSGANDCDLLDIGSIFTISPNPLSLPAANCASGSRTFTVDYLGIAGGPDCCETGGPLEQVVYDQTFPSGSAVVASSPFGGINNSAYLTIPGNNIGGEATSISLDIDLTGYCFNPPGAPTASDYWITVIADGVIIYDGQTINPGPVSSSLLFDLADFPFGYNSNTEIEIYVYPNAFFGGPLMIPTTYNPSAICTALADGAWTGQLTAAINATFEELAPTPTNCTFAETLAFDCCDYTPVANVSQNICNGDAMTQLATWQAAVNASQNSCIVYSSVTPVAGSVLPNNLFPTGVNTTTSPITQSVNAYAYCDANGSGTVNVGDTYSLISTYTVTIYPNANASISYNGSPFCTGITAAQTPVVSGTLGGAFSAAPAGLSINSATGIISLSGSSPGTYTVTYTIAASGGCPAFITSTTVIILEPIQIYVSGTNPSCPTICDGTATAVVTGGLAPYTYSWTGSASATSTITGLCDGSYTATVTDAAGCVSSCTPVIPTSCFQIQSILVNACGTQEGTEEMVFFQVGPNPLSTASLFVDWSTTNAWGGLAANNAGFIANVNATITGGGSLIAAPATLPAGANVVLITSNINASSQNLFTNITGPLYVLFQNANTTFGHFSNSSAVPTPFTMDFGGGCSDIVTYTATSLVGGDGASVLFTPGGIPTYVNNGCVVPNSIQNCDITIAAPPFDVVVTPTVANICSGSPVTMTASGATTYSWTPVTSLSSTTDATVVATPTSTITYNVTGFSGACSQTESVTINVTTPSFATLLYNGSPFCTDITAAQAPVVSGTLGGTFSAVPAGLSINSTTGAITPSGSAPGTYTVTYTIPAIGSCPLFSTNTSVVVTLAPAIPTLTPSNPCSGQPTTFIAGNGTTYEFYVNGISQGAPSSVSTFASGVLSAGDQVCVRSTPAIPFVMNGNINETQWGAPLATSASGPTSSGFGIDNNIDALYMKNMGGKLYCAIAGDEHDGFDQANNNWIVLFIDSKPGGYNNLAAWTNRTNVPPSTKGLLNLALYQNVTFDAGFDADYILTMNQANSEAYFDLYDMSANINTYLGSNLSNPSQFGFIGNAGVGDFTKGFEFNIPLSIIGSPTSNIELFAMMVNDPNVGVQTFLSNQFLTSASSAQGNFGDGAINFNVEPPSPINFILSSDCFEETCIIVLQTVTPIFNPIPPICYGDAAPVLPTNSTNGISGMWSSTVSNITSGTYLFTPTISQCTNTQTITVTVLPQTLTTPIYHD